MDNLYYGKIITENEKGISVKNAKLIKLAEHVYIDLDEAELHPYNILFSTHLNNKNMMVDKASITPIRKVLKNKSHM